jgi:hypothetical protein
MFWETVWNPVADVYGPERFAGSNRPSAFLRTMVAVPGWYWYSGPARREVPRVMFPDRT